MNLNHLSHVKMYGIYYKHYILHLTGIKLVIINSCLIRYYENQIRFPFFKMYDTNFPNAVSPHVKLLCSMSAYNLNNFMYLLMMIFYFLKDGLSSTNVSTGVATLRSWNSTSNAIT